MMRMLLCKASVCKVIVRSLHRLSFGGRSAVPSVILAASCGQPDDASISCGPSSVEIGGTKQLCSSPASASSSVLQNSCHL